MSDQHVSGWRGERLDMILRFWESEFEAQLHSDFVKLKGLPSTQVWRFLLGYQTLKPEDRPLVKSAVAKLAARSFVAWEDWPELSHAEVSARERCLSPRATGDLEWKLESLKGLKLCAGLFHSEHPRTKAQRERGVQEGTLLPVPAHILEWIDSLTTCKAPDLRRRVKAEFATRFGMKPRNVSGVWEYRNDSDPSPVEVVIEYGGTCEQLRYHVNLDMPNLVFRPRRVSFESLLLGLGGSDWDFITEEGADEAISLLADRIADVVVMVGRLNAA